MSNRKNGQLYLGQTENLEQRVWEHQSGIGCEFTRDQSCYNLVWFEAHTTHLAAIEREYQIKEWDKPRLSSLIEMANPEWVDLSDVVALRVSRDPEPRIGTQGTYAMNFG